MKGPIDAIPESVLLRLPTPAEELLKPETRKKAYTRRRAALLAVLMGASINRAAGENHISRACLTRQREQVFELALDGQPHGFRVCLPGYRCERPVPKVAVDEPVKAGPHAFGRLLKKHESLEKLVNEYAGPLPGHNDPSPKFDRYFKEFKKAVANVVPEGAYPLSSKDKGRRALTDEIKRRRRDSVVESGHQTADEARPLKFANLFSISPLDSIQTDGHAVDVNWTLRVPADDGGEAIVEISRLWILATIDTVSEVVYAVLLVLADEYNQFHFIEVHARILTPWSPRVSAIPDLQYHPRAWMPGAVSSYAEICRPNSESIDNAMSHASRMVLHNLPQTFLGVMNHGRAHVPEARSQIETFNKRLETYLLRKFPGAYRPANNDRGKQRTSAKRSADYPILPEQVRDCLEAFVSWDNVEPRVTLQQRAPRDIHEAHLESGAWVTQSTLTETHARQMMTVTIPAVTIRGSRRDKKHPYVDWLHGTYRSDKLKGRFDLVGKKFEAQVDLRDVRTLTLLDTGTKTAYVVLDAISPWSATAHSYEVRTRAHRWRSREGRHHDIGDDLAGAYLAYNRQHAFENRGAAYAYLAHDLDVKRETRIAQPLPETATLPPRKRVNLFGDKP